MTAVVEHVGEESVDEVGDGEDLEVALEETVAFFGPEDDPGPDRLMELARLVEGMPEYLAQDLAQPGPTISGNTHGGVEVKTAMGPAHGSHWVRHPKPNPAGREACGVQSIDVGWTAFELDWWDSLATSWHLQPDPARPFTKLQPRPLETWTDSDKIWLASNKEPAHMIREYIDRALRNASYDKLADGTFVGEVDGLQGVLASASTLEECRDQLAEVIEEWVLVRVSRGLAVPPVDGVVVKVTADS